mmetsp:Transcript_131510/g.327989  ORF Transcript_131510/g.327989 Transcript_131510/m.327989 type:complete len:95 (+) Transcript_131510:1398-1682(+)
MHTGARGSAGNTSCHDLLHTHEAEAKPSSCSAMPGGGGTELSSAASDTPAQDLLDPAAVYAGSHADGAGASSGSHSSISAVGRCISWGIGRTHA